MSGGRRFRLWFDWVVGTVTVIFGLALTLFGGILLFAYLQPRWFYYLLPVVMAGGIIQMIGGLRMVRHAGEWTD